MSYRPDHQHVRASRECPVCGARKELGLIACDQCWEVDSDAVVRAADKREREIAAEHSQFGVGA